MSLKEINKSLDEVATFEPTKKEDTIEFVRIAFKVMAILLSIRMSFPFKKPENKAKWQAWIERIKTGELLSNIIIKP